MNLIKDFYEWNPSVFLEMQKCSHHSDKHSYFSEYHGEGSIFAHTMLVYEQVLFKHGCLEMEIAALCHDIGKIYTRMFNSDNKKIVFYGHEVQSLEGTLSFCDFLHKKYGMFINIDLVFYLVANHMKKGKELKFISDNDIELLIFQNCDNKGRISSNCDTSFNDKMIKSCIFKKLDTMVSEPDVLIMSGIPGSGKDTIAKKKGYKVLSYDDIRVELYKESTGDTYYSNAWNWCNDNKINLNNYLTKKIKENIGTKIAICNTNISTKPRRAMKNIVKSAWKDATIGCEYVWVSKKTAIERDLQRKDFDKSVGERVIDMFYNRQSLVSGFEDFDSYKITINE